MNEDEVGPDVRFRLDPQVLDAFPEVQIRFVFAEGLRNSGPWVELSQLLKALEQDVAEGAWRPYDEQSPEIASWHEAYRSFGTNPRRCRPSVDALSRRLTRNGVLPRINPAVDAYNYVSVRYGLPAGAFDLDRIDGLVMIRFAEAGDVFTPLGEPDVVEGPMAGEVVYARESRVLTRHWNHRDADETKVTEQSVRAVFMLERVLADAAPDERMSEAQRELVGLLAPHADRVTSVVIGTEAPEAALFRE